MDKFDDHFRFQLTKDEWEILRSKKLTSKSEWSTRVKGPPGSVLFVPFYYFSPAKIKLTEGLFKAFSSRSNTMSQLQEEIGLPHIDGTGYCYYHLDGNRFVECRYLDDNLQSFFVVDSEKRLYSLGKQRGQKKNC